MPVTTVLWTTDELKTWQQEDAELNNIITTITVDSDQYYINEDGLLSRKENYIKKRIKFLPLKRL